LHPDTEPAVTPRRVLPDVMVDIETTGVRPDHAAILQIAAVRFDVETFEVDHLDMFNACLTIPADRYWSEDTRDWWLGQKPGVLQDIFDRMEPAEAVMERFYRWSTQHDRPVFWSKPLSFDYPFVASYFARYGWPMPYHHSTARDVRSFCAGVTFPNPPISDKDLEFQGDAHNAIFDVLHQIKYVFRVVQERRAGVVEHG